MVLIESYPWHLVIFVAPLVKANQDDIPRKKQMEKEMLPWVCQVTFCTVCKSISWTGPKNGEENDNYKETWKVLCKPFCPKVIENLMTPNWISIQSFIHPMFSVNVHVSFHKMKIMQTYTLCIHVRCTHIILLVYSYLQFLLAQNSTTTTLIPPKKGYETDVLQSWQSETAQVLSEPNPEAPWRRCNKKKGKTWYRNIPL